MMFVSVRSRHMAPTCPLPLLQSPQAKEREMEQTKMHEQGDLNVKNPANEKGNHVHKPTNFHYKWECL
jgi:hypothetical protein